MDAGQQAALTVEVFNTGAGKAYDVTGYISGDLPEGLTADRKAVLGDIPPGVKKLITFKLLATEKLVECEVPLKLAITEKLGRFPALIDIDLSCRPDKSGDSPEPTVINTTRNRLSLQNDIPDNSNVNSSSVAVIIGNRDYNPSTYGRYDYALRDARAMRDYLIVMFGYNPETIFYYQNATTGDFNEMFGSEKSPGELLHYVKSDTTNVFIYYSGRSTVDSETMRPYFLPVDCGFSADDVRESGYPTDLLIQKLNELSAHSVTLVIDSSFGEITGSDQAGMDIDDLVGEIDNGVIFTACSGSGIPNRYHEAMHGLFTYVYIKSISDMVKQGKTVITAGDLQSRLAGENGSVPQLSRIIFNGTKQQPQFLGNPDQVIVEVQ